MADKISAMVVGILQNSANDDSDLVQVQVVGIDVVLAELGSCFFGFSSESKLLHKIDYISSIFHKIHEIVLLILDKFLKMLQISFIHSELAWIWMIIWSLEEQYSQISLTGNASNDLGKLSKRI